MTVPEMTRVALRGRPAVLVASPFRLRQRGATMRPRQVTEHRQPRAQWLRRVFTPVLAAKCLALSLLVVTALVGARLAEQVLESPLREFVIEGDFKYLERADIGALLAPYMGSDFAKLPLRTLRGELMALPWVAGVELKRDWPDTLVLALEEEVPVARWGESMLINRDGQLFQPRHLRGLDGLPLLDGPAGLHGEVMSRFDEFRQVVGGMELTLSSLRVSERGCWRTGLQNGVELVIGQHQLVEKLQRFLALYNRILVRYLPDIQRIDLRYQNGVSVQWRNGKGPRAAHERPAPTIMDKE